MNLYDRMRVRLARLLLKGSRMAANSIFTNWLSAAFFEPTFSALVREGYKANGVVFACVSELAMTYPEPDLVVYQRGAKGPSGSPVPEPGHPLTAFLANPAPGMSLADLLSLTMAYEAIGGEAFWYKVRSRSRVLQVLPLSPAQITPIPGGAKLVDHYEWQHNDGKPAEIIPADDIVHFKWMPDPDKPWMGQAPLSAVAREVDTDNEATRYLFALLKNDAIPRLALVAPPEAVIDPAEMRKQWSDKYGDINRGGVVFLEGGWKAERLSMDLQEMAFEALRRVPEARICAAFRVPPVLAGVNVGLEQMTYNNLDGMRKHFTSETMARLWKRGAQTITAQLLPDFGDVRTHYVSFDLGTVTALQESQAEKRLWANQALTSRGITINEYRAILGMAPLPGGDELLPPSVPASEAPKVFIMPGERKALPTPRKVTITDGDVDLAIARWNRIMPEFAGLLEARAKEEEGGESG